MKQRGALGNSSRSIMIATAISLAGLLYGLDTGIIATTIAHESFQDYMYGPGGENSNIQGAIVSGYYAGSAIGAASAAYCMDRISRRWSLLFGACVSVVGGILQATAQNPGMMIAGRAFSGFSTGMVYAVAPVYLSEISPPENRAFLVGLKGLLNTFGSFLAGWIGYSGSFAVGDIQWRVPLATQAPPAALLALLTFFLPYSPRWLMKKERHEEAHACLEYLHAHRSGEFIEREWSEIQAQVRFEAQTHSKSALRQLFTRRFARRMLIGTLIINMCKLSGSNIIQNYQTLMYNNLGYEGRQALLITALYGFMAFVGQALSIFSIADHWPRRRTVIIGNFTLAVLLAILTGLSKEFADGHNADGSRAAIAFIFLFALAYSIFFNSINWVLVAEIFPLEMRAVGVGWSVFSQYLTAIWLSYAASYAFDRIHWAFYFVFIGTNVFAGTMYYLFLPETNQLTLERIASAFGDEVAEPVAVDLNKKLEMDEYVEDVAHVEAQRKS